MPKSLSHHLNLNPTQLKSLGVFDPILNFDTRLFINISLLQETNVIELKHSYDRIQKLFQDVLLLLDTSKKRNDVFWKNAVKRFSFHEVGSLCIGYSAKGTHGSGIGEKYREQLLNTGKLLIEAGIKDPVIFELAGLIEEGIGPDRLSDMVANIIIEDLIKYTIRINKEISITKDVFPQYQFSKGLFINPYNDKPVILMPIEILHELPVATGWNDIDSVCNFNNQLRDEINRIIGDTWKDYSISQKKNALKKIILRNPDILQQIIGNYKKSTIEKYDFENDPSGEYSWYDTSHNFAYKFPLSLFLSKKPSFDDVYKVVIQICNKFKELIEHNGLFKNLYYKDKPLPEQYTQRLFFSIADIYCENNNIGLSPETNSGRGSVDFKFSIGYKIRILVEIKLTTNPQLVHGYTKQIKEYEKAEKTNKSIYLIIDNGGPQKRIDELFNVKNNLEVKDAPEIIFVDGNVKKSASNY